MEYQDIEVLYKKMEGLSKKLEVYYNLLFLENELSFIINGNYILDEELDLILQGRY